MLTLGDFQVDSLGVDHPDYFQGYGTAFSDYTDSCYGIGNTEAEALNDCLEQMACSGRIAWTEDVERRIRDEFGPADDTVGAMDDCDDCVDCDTLYFHVGIKWNIREERRMARVLNLPNVEPLTYSAFERSADGWVDVVRADGSASYGDFRRSRWDAGDELYYFVPYASGSDYSGSTVERSNYEFFRESYGDNEWVHDVYGGHGTYAVAVRVSGFLGCDDDTFESICEAIEGLDDYPLLDESAHSELEMRGADEAWEAWAAADFRRELERKFSDIAEFEWPADSDLREFFEEMRERENEYWECEGYGPDMHIRLDRIIRNIDITDLAAYTIRYTVVYVDCGEVTEDYLRESEAAARVELLRAAGFMGAFYNVSAGAVEM